MAKLKSLSHKEELENPSFLKKISSSKFNYWFGYVSNLSLVIWLNSRAFNHFNSLLTWQEWLILPLLGLFIWTLVEYLLHKYAYHVWKSPLERGHNMHHERPYDLMGVPWYLTLVIIIAVYYGLSYVFNPAYLAIIMAYIWLGYVGYCITHHAIHHWKIENKLFKKLKKHHYIHHARDDKNIGIVTTFWDHIFKSVEN